MRRNILIYIVAGCCLLALTGCGAGTAMHQKPSANIPTSPPMPTPDAEVPDPEIAKPTPRAIAALTLSDQAKALLDQNKPDQAIRLLERAINLHPQNGEAYYYLAAAWLLKGNFPQASEFNRLAEIYFKNDALWTQRVAFQKSRLRQLQP